MKGSRSEESLREGWRDATVQAWIYTEENDGEESYSMPQEWIALQREKIQLEAMREEMRLQLLESRSHCDVTASFAPFPSIFPQSRDSFGLAKSSSQQIQIYRKEWQFVHKRFARANDTRYAYELERTIEEQQEKVKELERKKTDLKKSIYGVEREVVRMRGKDVEMNDTAQMRDLSAHVTLLRDQVRILESSDDSNLSLFQASKESLAHAKLRYRKMKQIARDSHISLKSPKGNIAKMTQNLLEKRMNRVQKWDFFMEEQRIKELLKEKTRYEQWAKELREELAGKEAEIGRKQVSLTSLRRGRGESERNSPVVNGSLKSFRVRKEVSLMLNRRESE